MGNVNTLYNGFDGTLTLFSATISFLTFTITFFCALGIALMSPSLVRMSLSFPPFVGCGCKLDIRDFSGKGKIDRKMYYITVKVGNLAQARAVVDDVRAKNLDLEVDHSIKVSYY